METLEYAMPAPRRRRTGLWISLAVGALVVAGVATVHVVANRTHDAAAHRLMDAAATATGIRENLRHTTDDATSTVDAGERIVAAAADGLADAASRDAFAARVAETAAAATTAADLLNAGADDGTFEKPLWTWELFTGAEALDGRAAELDAAAERALTAETDAATATQAAVDAAVALYATVPAAASALEQANISAVALTVLDLRDAAEAVAGQTQVGSGAAVAFETYRQRVDAITASQASELAEKAGRLYDTRLEIEAYARSISGGVVLDFDWAPIVAGQGGSTGIGGTATWNSARGGFSTITLSNSVAEWWPNPDSRALVAHEVGHSITSKCYTMFDYESSDANEEWATAWAISMGHTATGNGVYAYGYPSQTMIDLAATCR